MPELVEEIATRIIVLHDGEILAFDTLDGLQRLTGHRGTLDEVLQRLIFPETTRKLEAYLPGVRPMIGRVCRPFRLMVPRLLVMAADLRSCVPGVFAVSSRWRG